MFKFPLRAEERTPEQFPSLVIQSEKHTSVSEYTDIFTSICRHHDTSCCLATLMTKIVAILILGDGFLTIHGFPILKKHISSTVY